MSGTVEPHDDEPGADRGVGLDADLVEALGDEHGGQDADGGRLLPRPAPAPPLAGDPEDGAADEGAGPPQQQGSPRLPP